MKTYNRALDFTVLALSELKNGNGALAARLLAKAVEQSDITAAIATLEASNKHAFALQAKKAAAPAAKQAVASKQRLKANEEFPFDETAEGNEEVAADEFDADPLEEVADSYEEDETEECVDDTCEEEEVVSEMEEESPGQAMAKESPGQAMAKVLSKMVRKSGRK